MTTIYTAPTIRTAAFAPVIHEGAVVVEADTIAWIGAEADLPAEYEGATVSARSGTLAPGLVDTHVHLGFDGGPTPVERMLAETDTEQTVLMLRSARELLSAGVTTARDLGARKYLDVTVRDAIDRGDARGPRLLTSGAPLTTTGGHCWYMGGEADGAHELRLRVREHHQAGVNGIKVMSTGGFMTAGSAPWNPQFSFEELRFAIEDAHRLGLPVVAHAHGTDGIRAAALAGIDMIEHCSFVSPDGSFEFDREVADLLAERGVAVSNTLNVRMWSAILSGQSTPMTEHFSAVVTGLREAGVRVVCGTDAGIDLTPHHAYAACPENLHALGMTSAEAFDAATAAAADAIGLGAVTGTLEAGRAADLIEVDGDPVADLTVLRAPRFVVTRGVGFVPDDVPGIAEVGASLPTPALARK